MKHRYVECDCEDVEHTLRLSWYPDDEDWLYAEVHLRPRRPWYKRIWIGIKYIFGYRSKYGEYGEFLWGVDDVKAFLTFGAEYLADHYEHKAGRMAAEESEESPGSEEQGSG